MQFDLAITRLLLVVLVPLLERLSNQIVKVWRVIGTEQSPILVFRDSLHKQIGDPIRCVHVMRTPTIVASVFAKVQKLFNVQVPCFQIRANRAFAFTALINSYRRVADDFQKRNRTLALTIGAFDMAVGRSDVCPVITESTRPLRQFRVVGNALENVVQVI